MSKLEYMPGPTDEARVLQLRQDVARDAMYDALNNAREAAPDYEQACKDPAFIAALAAYNATVTELEALLGTEAHCNEVDCDLWSQFSDCYKEDVGFRPRHHVTRAGVQAYFDRMSEPAAA